MSRTSEQEMNKGIKQSINYSWSFISHKIMSMRVQTCLSIIDQIQQQNSKDNE